MKEALRPKSKVSQAITFRDFWAETLGKIVAGDFSGPEKIRCADYPLERIIFRAIFYPLADAPACTVGRETTLAINRYTPTRSNLAL